MWARDQLSSLAAVAPVSGNLLADLETALGSNLLGATVVRIRGIASAIPPSGSPGAIATLGALVLPSATTAAAVTTVTEPFADWMLYEPFVATSPASSAWPFTRIIDVRSARKIEELDQELRFVWDAVPIAPAGGWNFVHDLSIGLKLP